MRSMRVCKLFGCQSRVHRFGLCNKHRKWVERGYMTEDCKMLKEPRERPGYKDQVCKIPNCINRPRRNWLCVKHSTAVKTGRMNLEGERTAKRARPHAEGDKCKLCGMGGKITKELCRTHYGQYWRGNIDLDGNILKPFARVHKYSENAVCKADRCGRRPRVRGWCMSHWPSFKLGKYDQYGRRIKPRMFKNKGRPCSKPGCGLPAKCVGLCSLHYSRKRINYMGPAGRKNVGQTCIEKFCDRPAAVRAMCTRHYYYWKRDQKRAAAHKVSSEPSKSSQGHHQGGTLPV